MSRYRRFDLAGGTFFLTLFTIDRRPILRSRLALDCLWSAYRYARGRRSEEDVARCLDYIRWNPVKHGLVGQVRHWKASSFRR